MALQHFVPRFVLNHFASDAIGSTRRAKVVSVLDLATRKTFQTAVTKVAASNRLYDFVAETGETLSVDPFLTDVEQVTAPAWRKLAGLERISDLDRREREALALFITTLAIRGPSIRAQIEGVPGLVLEHLRKSGEAIEGMKEFFATSDGRDAEIHASIIVKLSRLYHIIAGRTWLLFKPPSNRRFCISDCPVALFNEIDNGPAGNVGFLVRGICLQVAISPELLLIIADGDAYGVREADSVTRLGEEHLLRYNALLARFAHRHLYACSALDFNVPDGSGPAGRPWKSSKRTPGRPSRKELRFVTCKLSTANSAVQASFDTAVQDTRRTSMLH